MAIPNVYTPEEQEMLRKWDHEMDDLVGWLAEEPGLGKAYPYYNTEATQTLMRNFALANDCWNPLWRDEHYAKYTRWGRCIANPLYSSVIFYSPPWPALEIPESIGYRFGKVWWEETRHYREIYEGDTFRIWTMRPTIEDVTDPNEGTRMFRITSLIYYINQHGEAVDSRSRTMLLTIVDKQPKPGSGPAIAPGYRYTKEDLALIDRMCDEEIIRGRKILFWEDVQLGEELQPTVWGPITAWDSCMGISGVGCTTLPMREVRRITPDATFLDPVTGVSHKEVEIHLNDEAARLVSGRPIGVGYEVLLARTVTNWMGDDAEYRNLNWRNFGAMEMGGTFFVKAKVVGKYVEKGEHRVDILCWIESIKGHTTAAGVTSVKLLSYNDARFGRGKVEWNDEEQRLPVEEKFHLGDKVRVLEHYPWSSDADQRFAGMTGTVFRRSNRELSEEPDALKNGFIDVIFDDDAFPEGVIPPPTFPVHVGPGKVYAFHESRLEAAD